MTRPSQAEFKSELFENRKFRPCYWCGRRLKYKAATIDHIKPLADGGGEGLENKVVCCYGCNQIRSYIYLISIGQVHRHKKVMVDRAYKWMRDYGYTDRWLKKKKRFQDVMLWLKG